MPCAGSLTDWLMPGNQPMTDYRQFIASKEWKAPAVGFAATDLPSCLFDFQAALVKWACRKGRAALFEDCGLGKTIQQLAWAQQVQRHTGGIVIILAPLAVAAQTAREGGKFGINIRQADGADAIDGSGIYITNYEKIHKFDGVQFAGVVLDESSIIKAHDGKTRTAIIERFITTPYKLACTATPSPNDTTELGNHAEFLGVMTRTEMLASFFMHDGGETSVWRLKGHATKDFWRWVASWAAMIRSPADIGFPADSYVLPTLTVDQVKIETGIVQDGALFTMAAVGLDEQRKARRSTMESRCRKLADLVNASDEQWLIWCEMNDEGDTLESMIAGAVQVAGSDDDESKASKMMGFTDGVHRVLISKVKIAGFGMNWQQCRRVAFVGLSHSYEGYYQAVRRCFRFGQKRPVIVTIIATDLDTEVVANIERKQSEADAMAEGMILHMKDTIMHDINGTERQTDDYVTGKCGGKNWNMYLGDCVESIGRMPSNSVGFSVFSPPFASLYTYSNSPLDMGNCKGQDEFFRQFLFLTRELFRVLMEGRLVSFHCMNLPTSKERDGFIGISDFRGTLIRAFQDAGFIYHSEVVIWKDPVTAMQRTKALGLLHKTIRKDSSMSRQGIPDYLVTMRKPGKNAVPISHGADLPVQLWQQYASPVWMDINPSDTLQGRSAREENDERHICPLQLQVIERAMHLWSAPGDLVLSPFAGIGSEGYQAIKMGRRFVGCELKRSYFNQACANLAAIELDSTAQLTLFDQVDSADLPT